MEKYSKAVREMYSQFKEVEHHRVEEYIWRLGNYKGEQLEVVGYWEDMDGTCALIVDGTKIKGWCREMLDPMDMVFKDCEEYAYVGINDLID